MGFSELRHGCKKHHNHEEKRGVCPECLREKLSRLCSFRESNLRVTGSLSFSPAENPWASSSFMAITSVGSNGLKKSKSLAFVARNFNDDDGEEVGNGKMKNKEKKGFWSKLLRFKEKNKDFLMHSSSTRFIIGRVK